MYNLAGEAVRVFDLTFAALEVVAGLKLTLPCALTGRFVLLPSPLERGTRRKFGGERQPMDAPVVHDQQP